MQHQHLTDHLRDTATFYALGMLGPEEAQVFAKHFNTGCTLCTEELQAVERVVSLLGYDAPTVQPRPEVRSRLLAGLATETAQAVVTIQPQQRTEADRPRFYYVHAGEGHWQEFSPGVSVKILFTDPATKRSTTLVRMTPGARLERHRHLSVEEVFVLEGDCHIAPGHVLRAGDYFRAEAGSEHGITFTEEGTTILTLHWNEFPA